MRMNVGYEWLRDTQDFGGYEGPHFIIMPSRKFRGSRYVRQHSKFWFIDHDWNVSYHSCVIGLAQTEVVVGL